MMELTQQGKETLNKLDKLSDKAPKLFIALLKEFGAAGVTGVKKQMEDDNVIDSGALISTVRSKPNKDSVSILAGGIKPKFLRGIGKNSGKPINPNRANKVVTYADYVNSGTSRQPGRFFMERGVNRSLSDIKNVGVRILDNWIKNLK